MCKIDEFKMSPFISTSFSCPPQISSQAEQLFTINSLSTQEKVDLLCTSLLASKFAVRLHLVTLLFEVRNGTQISQQPCQDIIHHTLPTITLYSPITPH